MLARPLLCLGAWFVVILFAAALPAEIITFSNSTAITIPALGVANPYPTVISVNGVNKPVSNFTLSLNGVTHTWTDDLAAAVVSPGGQAVLLFSGPGPSATDPDVRRGVANQTWTFDDRAAATMPQRTRPTSGTYRPGLWEWDDSFPGDSAGRTPIGMNYGFNFNPFLTGNPNGDWLLYVMDGNVGDSGGISNGWSISFDLTPTSVPEPSVIVLSLLGLGTAALRARRKSVQTRRPEQA